MSSATDCDYTGLGPTLAAMLIDGYRLIRDSEGDERAWDPFGNIAYGVASALKAGALGVRCARQRARLIVLHRRCAPSAIPR